LKIKKLKDFFGLILNQSFSFLARKRFVKDRELRK